MFTSLLVKRKLIKDYKLIKVKSPMSIDNIPKSCIEALIMPLVKSDLEGSKVIDKIKSSSAQYGKFTLLMKQADFLRQQLQEVINESILNVNLHEVKCGFKKISGNNYHLYKKDGSYYFSLLSPSDWNEKPPNEFVASYLFDFDKSFKLITSS